ncbi:MAG: hypothetical protein SGJ02_07970 [bacterium]|nr:hypothetical protein [bacterium]
MNRNFLITLLLLSVFCFGCDRREFDFAGKPAPKNAPEYTNTAEQSRNQ